MVLAQIIAALVAICLLAAIGWGTRRVLDNTNFLAEIVERNMAQAAQQVEADQEAPAPERHNMPIGFGVQLRND